MITLYQYEMSPFCDKIRRVLHVKRQPYQVQEVRPSQSLGWVKKNINPIGKLPCLEHDGRTVADSTDIARYLEQTFPEPPLLPTDPKQRALCHILEDWADESLYFYEMRLRFTFPKNAQRWISTLVAGEGAILRKLAPIIMPRYFRDVLSKQGLGRKPEAMVLDEVERHLDALAGCLGETEWLVGDGLSLADISVFVQLFCFQGAEEGSRLIEARPAVARWMERVDEATAPPS